MELPSIQREREKIFNFDFKIYLTEKVCNYYDNLFRLSGEFVLFCFDNSKHLPITDTNSIKPGPKKVKSQANFLIIVNPNSF